ncbi:acyl-CoA dehydrogenase [Gordonia hongkongensis]|uniref:acyl-CoA dehydrogenase n=1 Tax=Gordonia hongkongensis TaxID=1701090 RepID=UPI0030D3F065
MTLSIANPLGAGPVTDSGPRTLPDDIRAAVQASADALDGADGQARGVLAMLGAVGLADLGAPRNTDVALPEMARIISDLAEECVSSAFTTWANRMAIEYLTLADSEYARQVLPGLRSGTTPGITGMASAFRDLAGCGSIEITATPDGDGYLLNGPIRWASNLYDDALLVTAARTTGGDRIVVALPLSQAGVAVGKPFSLLALNATASSYLNLTDVRIGGHQVLTRDFETFLGHARPTFLVLQTAICAGLARTCLDNARGGLVGVNSVFAGEVDALGGKLALVRSAMTRTAHGVGGPLEATRPELLSMRLAGAEVACAAAGLEARTAGGKGYASRSGASRRFREAAFIPVQSPSEAQLRWELAQCSHQ